MIIRNSVSANVAHRCLNAADVRLSDLEEAFGMKNGAHLPERSERLGAIREADLRSRAEADVDSGSARGGGRRGVGDGGAGSASRTVIQRCFHILATTLLTIATIIAPGSAEVLSSLFVEDAYSGSKQTEVSSDHAALLKNGFDAYHSAPQDRPWSVDAAMKYLKGALGPASVPGEFPTQAALKRFLGNLVRVGGVAPTPAFAAAAPVAAQAAPAAAAAAAAVQLATAAPPPPPQGPRGREPASLALVPPPAAQEESETRHSSRGRLIKESRRRAGGL